MDYTRFTSFFDTCADAAGEIALKYFRKTVSVDEKDDKSPVTQADREIEQKFRDMLKKTFPGHGIIGEEFGRENDTAEFVWVIDPIDGTRAFMTGKPLFGTIIGLMHGGKPVAGMVNQAFTRERWFGIADRMATHNGKPIRVAPPRKLDAARLFIGSPEMFQGAEEKYKAIRGAARWQQYACDCYAYGLLAMGWADLVIEQNLKIYDAVGIVPIVTGAGGFIADWKMKPVTFDFDGHLVAASSKELAAEAAAVLSA